MGKKHRKERVNLTPDRPKKRKVKTDVRLMKAEDVVWMMLDDIQRKMDFVGTWINEVGFKVELSPRYTLLENIIVSMGWKGVASVLGKDVCEYCLNADGESYVLLYNVMEVEA